MCPRQRLHATQSFKSYKVIFSEIFLHLIHENHRFVLSPL